MPNKYFAWADEEDRLDRELEKELPHNLHNLAQQAIERLRATNSSRDRRVARVIEELVRHENMHSL